MQSDLLAKFLALQAFQDVKNDIIGQGGEQAERRAACGVIKHRQGLVTFRSIEGSRLRTGPLQHSRSHTLDARSDSEIAPGIQQQQCVIQSGNEQWHRKSRRRQTFANAR